jgi:hypothetical protein
MIASLRPQSSSRTAERGTGRIPEPSTTYAARAGDVSERQWPLSPAYAEPDNLRTLTARKHTSAQRAESAIRTLALWNTSRGA